MSVRILVGDAVEMMRTLADESVQCVVTSPPYYALRDYGVAGQIGLEATPAEFVERLCGVFDEVWRVLRADGVCFVNLGDSYAGSGKGPTGHNGIGDQEQRQGSLRAKMGSVHGESGHTSGVKPPPGYKAKDLLLIPERFAIAMQERGWWVRSRIAWCKKSAMPESVRDRPTSAWEHIWMFTKSARYYWDGDAVRTPQSEASIQRYSYQVQDTRTGVVGHLRDGMQKSVAGDKAILRDSPNVNPLGASLRNFWLLGPEPSGEEHYASFPTAIPRRCILAATSERGQCPECGKPWVRVVEKLAPVGRRDNDHADQFVDFGMRSGRAGSRPSLITGWQPGCQCDAGDPIPQTVLDPFLGSGTTALVADQLGRNAIGVELNPAYAEMARRRITNDAPMFAEISA